MNNVQDVETLSDKLISYLRAKLGNPAIDFVSPLTRLQGGYETSNILYAADKVTGVLDWPGFAIADPVFDVANSIVLITISGKHLAASMGDFSSVDWDLVADLYLAAYRAHRSLDDTNLGYYRVRRCVMALVQGFEGQAGGEIP